MSNNYFYEFFILKTYGWNYIISNIMIVISIASIFNDCPYTTKRGVLIHALDYIITYGVFLCLSAFFFYFNLTVYLNFIVFPIIILLHSFILNNFRHSDRFCKSLSLTSFIFLFFPLTSALGIVFHLWDNVLFVVIPFFLFSIFILNRFKLDKFSKICNSSIILEIVNFFVVFSIVITINLIGLYNVNEKFQLVLFIGLYILTFAGTYLFYKLADEQEKALKFRAESFKNHNDYELLIRTNENIEDLKKMRHDMRNQYQYMQILLKNKNYEALDTFFSDMNENSFVPLNFVNCGNNAVSGVMNMEIHKAQKKNVKINHSLLVPNKMPITDFDLARLLINLIDNAIEGSVRDKIENPTITVNVTFKDPLIIISIKNPVDGSIPIKDRQVSDKPKSEIHGYGKKIIKDIIDKYQGESKIEIVNNEYCFYCMLRLIEVK